MENQDREHLFNIARIFIPFIFMALVGYGQSTDSLRLDLKGDCEKNFSLEKIDSTFNNFYIKDFGDTVYFRNAICTIQAQTTTPVTFKRRIKNGYANGFIRIYLHSDNSYTWIDGKFSEGFISSGSHLEYYHNGTLKISGQYEYGHRYGIWTWYFENGKINRIIIYEIADVIREIEYDIEGNIIEDYDFVKEKTNANTK